ncbi:MULTISPECIES: hypothetical protein [unclassified Streptomyces]|uniref:hypothetical protein n=1 Tax=unclassified Streptomyces TaxID=2593676 RepID=UPI001319E96A|nr:MULTISPECIES: hypothetical protein [unclassified Streptomyces]MYX36507.1 hypothetical protein [Streptomyces sp. SID8377]
MRLQGDPVTADRALLVNELRFDPDVIYELDRPLMLAPGDQVHVVQDQQVVIKRAGGHEERPVGQWIPWCWSWRLV